MAEYPFAAIATASTEESLPMFREYTWDFDNDCFIYDEKGNHILLEANEALKVWCFKALKTERFRYLAYTHGFGIELYPFMAKVMGVLERKSELRRMLIEALMVNPYIQSIDSITFEEKDYGEDMEITIVMTTVYGELVI